MKQNRLKSWALWLSISALIVFCLKTFFCLDVAEPVNGLMNALLPVLAGFGIVNDPTTRDHI
ncbi:MAG: hypothetical protein IKP32_00645 [Clostridia bacterium]|nr:hypothetical protein [Clostridia bacterium]